MWPYNGGLFGFQGPGGGVPQTPWQTPLPNRGNVPWWADVGVGLADRLGVIDWFGDWLGTGGYGQQGGQGGQYPATTGGTGTAIPANLVSENISDAYKPGSPQRKTILEYYQSLEGAVGRFVEWMKGFGLVASIASRLQSGNILEWPMIIQDLIILFYHNQPKANELAPTLVTEANKTAPAHTGQFGGSGSYLGTLAQLKPPTLPLVPREAYYVPKGYVLVTDPQSGQKVVVLKELAKAAGLYKSRVKAPITGSEWRAYKKGKSIENKMARMLGDSSKFKVTKKR